MRLCAICGEETEGNNVFCLVCEEHKFKLADEEARNWYYQISNLTASNATLEEIEDIWHNNPKVIELTILGLKRHPQLTNILKQIMREQC